MSEISEGEWITKSGKVIDEKILRCSTVYDVEDCIYADKSYIGSGLSGRVYPNGPEEANNDEDICFKVRKLNHKEQVQLKEEQDDNG